GNLLRSIGVVLTGAKAGIQKLAGNVGEIDLTGIFVLQFLQATACTAVAQALPFGIRHLLQGFGFPKESCLGRQWSRWCGHVSPETSVSFASSPVSAAGVESSSSMPSRTRNGLNRVHPAVKIKPGPLVYGPRSDRRKGESLDVLSALGSPQHSRKTSQRRSAGCPNVFEAYEVS